MEPETTEQPEVTETPEATQEPAPAEETTQEPEQPESGEELEQTPETPEEGNEEPEGNPEEGGVNLEYNEYENVALQQAVDILKTAEIPVEESNAIFAEAINTGDLSKVDLATLQEKLGKDKADLVMILAKSYVDTTVGDVQKITEEAHKLVGGEENFKAMREWASKKEASDPEFAKVLADIRTMADSGSPVATKSAVQELARLWKEDPNTTIPAELMEGDAPGNSQGIKPMTRREYADAINAARIKGTYNAERQGLWARRQAGMKQGI